MNENKDKNAESLIAMAEANQNYMLRLCILVAEQKRTFFQSLVTEGFSEPQALELTKHFPK